MGRVLGSVCRNGILLTAGLSLNAPAAPQEGRTPVFSADVSLVTIPATVRDDSGPLPDLTKEDFSILERGRELEVSYFQRRTDLPLSVVVMLDTSLSAAIQLPFEKESAIRFVDRLLGTDEHAQDAASVLSFSSEVSVLQDFSRDRKALASGLGKIRPQTGTSVYDAIWLASEELAKRPGRRVIVLVTDGGDTTSFASFHDALRSAHLAEALIYPLIVLPILSDAGRNRGGEHALITLAKKTGGEAFVQHGTKDLDAAFDKVLRSLRTQYLLGFYPQHKSQTAKEVFREVEVRVRRKGAVVLARSGYYDLGARHEEALASPKRSRNATVAVPSRPRASESAPEAKSPDRTAPVRRPGRPAEALQPKNSR